MSIKLFSTIEKRLNKNEALKTIKLDLSGYKTSKFIDGLEDLDDSRMTSKQFEQELTLSNLNTPMRQVILS